MTKTHRGGSVEEENKCERLIGRKRERDKGGERGTETAETAERGRNQT